MKKPKYLVGPKELLCNKPHVAIKYTNPLYERTKTKSDKGCCTYAYSAPRLPFNQTLSG